MNWLLCRSGTTSARCWSAATLLGHWWHDAESERGEHDDQSGEDDRHRQWPSQPAPAQRLDHRIEGKGQEEGDDQQGRNCVNSPSAFTRPEATRTPNTPTALGCDGRQ
jgi:hypothetical protein